MHIEYGRNSKKKIKKIKNKERKTALMFLKSFKLINELKDELIF